MGTHYSLGKELLYKENDSSNHLGDMHNSEIANSLAARANHSKRVAGNSYDLDFDYPARVTEKLSPTFNPEKIDWIDFRAIVLRYIETAKELDRYYRVLFRAKSPEQMGLTIPVPDDGCDDHLLSRDADLIHGIIGGATETGEMLEIVLKLLHKEPVDRVNALEECGDIGFYRQLILTWLGITDHECNVANVEKLHGRFGGAIFNEVADRVENRNLEAEREKLSQHETKPLI